MPTQKLLDTLKRSGLGHLIKKKDDPAKLVKAS
jgi:hypothetical protein